jgi:hypothetical protein
MRAEAAQPKPTGYPRFGINSQSAKLRILRLSSISDVIESNHVILNVPECI